MPSLRVFPGFLLLGLFILTPPSWAGLLCDPGCQVEISFANGGSIEAVEQATFTFGNSGIIDTGTTSTAYLNEETLVLNAGNSLQFANGGSLTLGDLGNIEYTHLVINTDDSVNITAGNEFTRVSIDSDHSIVFSGESSITIQADEFVLAGSLVIDGSLILEAKSSTTSGGSGLPPDSCTLNNSSGSGVTLSSGESYDLTSGSICTQISQDIQIPDLEIGGEIQNPDPVITPGEFTITTEIEEENGSSGSFDLIAAGLFFIALLGKAATVIRRGLA